MNRNEFLSYNDTLCKFKFRGGKEVFGVIWEKSYGNKRNYFFSTAAERIRYKMAEQVQDSSTCEKLKMAVALEDIVLAEPLS